MAGLGRSLIGLIILGGCCFINGCGSEAEPAGNEVAESHEDLWRRRVPCASSEQCKANEFCTTETGACNPPPGCRPGQVCPTVCYGVCRRSIECRRDRDCRTFSDYCTGCDCRALARGEPDPVCPGPGVQCFVDPCLNQHAVCVGGQCELEPQSE
jgi:hypothetical protein